MLKKGLSFCLVLALLIGGTALAVTGLPSLDALSAIAKNAKVTPLALPDVFEIAYRTPDGELFLSRDENGWLTYVEGDVTRLFVKTGEDAYLAATPADTGYNVEDLNPLTFEQVKEAVAPIWQMIEPNERNERSASTAIFDKNIDLLGRKASRYRISIHEGNESSYSVELSTAVWYTFDKDTGVCLMKETAADENRKNAEVVFECIKYTVIR